MASFSSPWPDPNSPFLSKIDFGIPLSDLLLWLDIRDTFLGQNRKEQNIAAALHLAQHCKHPDAVWLTSIFEGKEDVSGADQAREVFLSFGNDDARALCFSWFLSDDRWSNLSLVNRAADMGYAFACSGLCERLMQEKKHEAFQLALKAAAHFERDGFGWLGFCFRDGIGCDVELNSAKENLLIAGELGDAQAADAFGHFFGQSDPVRWLWCSRAASHGYPYSFVFSFSEQVVNFFNCAIDVRASVVFLIGRALKGSVDIEKKYILGFRPYNFDFLIDPANQAVEFYNGQVNAARLAVDTWTLISTRLRMIKDMRVFIGKMIWEARFEANYEFDLDDDALYVLSPQTNLLSASSPKRSRK